MLGHTLWHPSSFRVANKTRHLDSCSPINKLSFGLHLAPSPSAPNSRFEHHLKHEIDPAFGRAANIKPDILDGQPNNKLNFSRRPAPSPPDPPKKHCLCDHPHTFFCRYASSSGPPTLQGGRRPTTTTKTEVKFVDVMMSFLEKLWSWRCVILSSAWVWAEILTIRLEAFSALNKIVKSTQSWWSWNFDVNTLTIAALHPQNCNALVSFPSSWAVPS